MKLICSILISCLLFIGQAQAANFNLLDATSFDPQPVVVSAADNSVPVGTVIIWTKEAIPDGWLECDGQVVNETLYPDLHKLMSTTPNYHGMFLRGVGTQTVNHGGYGNTAHSSAGLGQVQGDTIRNLTGEHHGPALCVFNGWCNPTGILLYTVNNVPFQIDFDASGAPNGHTTGLAFNAARQVPTSTENRPVNIAVKYIIKAE